MLEYKLQLEKFNEDKDKLKLVLQRTLTQHSVYLLLQTVQTGNQ